MSDEFEKWLDESGWTTGDDTAKRFAQDAFTAGQASGRAEAMRELMARWPSDNEVWNDITQLGPVSCSNWLRHKLFPNEKQDDNE